MTDAGPDPPRGPGPAFFRRRRFVAGAVLFVVVAGGFVATWAVQRYVTFPTPPAGAWNPAALGAARGEEVECPPNARPPLGAGVRCALGRGVGRLTRGPDLL